MGEWDLRKGEMVPTFIRLMFELMEDGKVRERKEIQDRVLPEMAQPIAESTVASVLRNLSNLEFLDIENSGKYMAPNAYSITEEGWGWWNKHKEEGWGYGRYWYPEVKEAEESKLGQAVKEGRSVRIPMPCDRALWNQIKALSQAGEIEIVVRRKRDG